MTNPISSISLSGMAAAEARLGASAHNIANAQTPQFHRQLVSAQTQLDGGVTTRFETDTTADGEMGGLAADLVTQHEALYAFKANLRVLQTADGMLGSLLDKVA